MIQGFAVFIALLIGLFLLFRGVKLLRPDVSKTTLTIEYIVFTIYFISNLAYILWFLSTKPYYERIDIVDTEYELLASNHILPLVIFYILFVVSLFLVWTRAWKLPPMIILLCNCFLLIGVCISCKIVIHGSANKEHGGSTFLLSILPVMNIVLAFYFFYKLMLTGQEFAQNKVYKNKILNKINQFLSESLYMYFGVLVFAFPIYYLITLILILFGQDQDAMTKVFTETTNWVFSQKEHPPYLDHQGHYLCTVAAHGKPNLVKPLFIGIRHQKKIIVNRQLQIANAFEEIIQVKFPNLHRFIRKNYDQYGYNLSQKINNPFFSNMTYILMKPLEWVFLTFIYTVSLEPEKLIKKQYNQFYTI